MNRIQGASALLSLTIALLGGCSSKAGEAPAAKGSATSVAPVKAPAAQCDEQHLAVCRKADRPRRGPSAGPPLPRAR